MEGVGNIHPVHVCSLVTWKWVSSLGFWIVSSARWWWGAGSKRWSDSLSPFSHRTRPPLPTCPAAWEQHDWPAAGEAPRARPPPQPSAAEAKVSFFPFSWKLCTFFIWTNLLWFCNHLPCTGKIVFTEMWVGWKGACQPNGAKCLCFGYWRSQWWSRKDTELSFWGLKLSLFLHCLLNLGPWTGLWGIRYIGLPWWLRGKESAC